MSENVTPTPSPAQSALRLWGWRLARIVFSVAFTWLLVEILLRALFAYLPQDFQLILQHVHKHPFTDETLLPPPVWQPDTRYLTISRPVQNYDQVINGEVRFTVNTEPLWGSRAAFRTRQELVDQHVDGVALGDSFTFCFTEETDCWVQQLAARTGRNIINLGITSTGSVSHLRVLEDFGMPLKPPLVLWQWYGNDANEDYGLAKLNGETNVLSTTELPPPPPPSWWDENSALYAALKLMFGPKEPLAATLQFHDPVCARSEGVHLCFGRPYLWRVFDMSQPNNADGWQRSQQALRQAQKMVSDYGGALVIVLIPTKEQVYRELSEPLLGAEKLAVLDEGYQMMLDFCAEAELTCLDPLTEFQRHAQNHEQLYYATDAHLNPHGNAVLAQWLADWLDAHADVFSP